VCHLQESEPHLKKWIDDGRAGSMAYMERNIDKRLDPSLLVEGSRSVISLLCNYYPSSRQEKDCPTFASYAYGKDYHTVLKERMHLLCKLLKEEIGDFSYRVFTDSAPVLEREWARRAGLGVIGKSGMLISPTGGSYFFISEIICDLELEEDSPLPQQDICKGCRKCQMACPTGAIDGSRSIDARRCLSYHTIESHDDIPRDIASRLSGRVYGCDICLEVCPWNRLARPTHIEEFLINAHLRVMKKEDWEEIDQERFNEVFKDSPIKRAGIEKIRRTLREI
ncbi:MAG: tRNA epoxyqueuosine(34) reductase QueG, partial [Flavobacteriales bacterium]|nr:tRNA epoxyqueuosine(34) reductase QueG [Flavobacteriales bacterium]